MKQAVLLFLVFCVIHAPVRASDYYAGFSSGNAAQQITLTVIDNSTDPHIPNVLLPKDYQADELDVNSGSLFLGYRMGRDMALEVGVTLLADMVGMKRTIDTVDNDPATSHVAEETVGLSLRYVSLLGVWPISENLAIQLRAGVASWSFAYSQAVYLVDNNTQVLSHVEAYRDTDFSGLYGAGFSYAVGDWIELSLKYEALKIKPEFVNITAEDAVRLLSLGLMMHF